MPCALERPLALNGDWFPDGSGIINVVIFFKSAIRRTAPILELNITEIDRDERIENTYRVSAWGIG